MKVKCEIILPYNIDCIFQALKQEVRFLLYILGQIVNCQYIPNPLD